MVFEFFAVFRGKNWKNVPRIWQYRKRQRRGHFDITADVKKDLGNELPILLFFLDTVSRRLF